MELGPATAPRSSALPARYAAPSGGFRQAFGLVGAEAIDFDAAEFVSAFVDQILNDPTA